MVRCLSFHQTYQCGRSGRCCTSNWPIPIEPDRLARVRAAVATRAISTRATGGNWIADPGPPAILASSDGQCAFHRSDAAGHACAVQTVLGHDALPLACRQFPRVSVLDPAGASVVLSLYCPTAARLLDAPGPVSIISAPAAFPDDGEYVGLDAREGWPPILRPGVLMDWPAWRHFETRAVDAIANQAASPDEAMARLRDVVEYLRNWSVGAESLIDRIDSAFEMTANATAGRHYLGAEDRGRVVARIHAAIPSALRPAAAPETSVPETPVRHLRFLASHAFANWAIHLGEDLRAWLHSLEDAHALLGSGFSVGEADLRLRHLAPAAGLREEANTPPADQRGGRSRRRTSPAS